MPGTRLAWCVGVMWTPRHGSLGRAAHRARWLGTVSLLGLFTHTAYAQPVPEAGAGAAPTPQAPPPAAASDELLLPPAAPSAPSAAPAATPAPSVAEAPISLVEFMRHRRALRREDPRAFPAPSATPADEHASEAQRLSSMMLLSQAFLMVNYLGSAIAGMYMTQLQGVEGRVGFAWLFLPVAGPFIAGATLGPGFDDGERALLYINGAAQAFSAALFVAATMGRSHELDKAHDAAKKKPIAIAPLVLPSGGGLALGGSF
jgi:hypothetical protein